MSHKHDHNQTYTLRIHGMHCKGCEVLMERRLKEVSGIHSVHANYHSGSVRVTASSTPDLALINSRIKSDGYSASFERAPQARSRNTALDYTEIGAVAMVLFAGYLLLSRYGLIPELSISQGMSYGFVFVIGLVAAVSTCMAVSGGLLLALSARYSEQHPQATKREKFVPHLYFNIGRLLSYTVLGALVGALGSALALSPTVNGIITIIAAVVMLILGLNILKLFPRLSRLIPHLPKALGHKVHTLSERTDGRGSFALGAATFFLPCGFTQALQLYVLSQGSAMVGALTMFFFALGTLPALLTVGFVSSVAEGTPRRYLMKVAGVLALVLGFYNLQAGFTLAGIDTSTLARALTPATAPTQAVAAEVVDGKQIARMTVSGLSYFPSQFVVKRGLPVEWRIDGRNAAGCGQIIVARKLNLTEYLKPDAETVITFTPQEAGTIEFSCAMGMTTRGAKFIVQTS